MTTLEDIISSLPDSPVVIDCGANEGQWISRIKPNLHGSPSITSIEMLAREAECCRVNHPDITVLNCAVGARNGEAVARRHGFSQSSSILVMTETHNRIWDSSTNIPVGLETVQVRTLDSMFPDVSVDLLKLDLQGYELEALKGGVNLLSRTVRVISEIAWFELYEGQPLFTDIDGFLQSHGFRFVDDFDVRMHWNDKAAGDGLWTRQ